MDSNMRKVLLITFLFWGLLGQGQIVNGWKHIPPIPGGGCPTGTLVYTSDFTTDPELDPYSHGQIGNGIRNTSIWVSTPSSFESIPANVSGGWRSEVQFDHDKSPLEGCIEYDVRYEVIVQDNCHSFQFHPETSGGSASPGLWHNNGEFELVNWKASTNTHYPTGVNIPQNVWMHLRHEFKFGVNGYWHLYKDNVLILNINNVQIGDGSGQYVKVGFNCFSSAGLCNPSRIYYDNLRIYQITAQP